MDEQPRRSWLARNWKWAVPLGCLSPLLVMGGCTAVVLVFVFGALRSSDAFTDSFAMVSTDPRVVVALGEPIEASLIVTGQINFGAGGNARISYGISGPKDAAMVYVVAEVVGGEWQFLKLECEFESSGQRINLLDREDGTDRTASVDQLPLFA